MTSRSLAGCDEIDAAKRRLAVAKKWESSTADALEAFEVAAKRLREQAEEARLQVEKDKSRRKDACDEVEEAEAYLEGIERKWEVIDVDDGGDSPARKKRKTQHATERSATRTSPRIASRRSQRSVSPVGNTSGASSVFHLHARPTGPLGLFIDSRLREKLEVKSVMDDSPLAGKVKSGDVIIEFDGVDTENMDLDTFKELLRTKKSDGERKVTFRRRAEYESLSE